MSNFGRNWRPTPRGSASSQLTDRANELRASLRLSEPGLIAERSGASYLPLGPARGELHVPLWGNLCVLSWPDLTCYDNNDDEYPPLIGALLLYYLTTSDGVPLTGRLVSFADLPDGRMYNAAFQGYSGDEVAKVFSFDLESFKKTCVKAGGQSLEIGSASFMFQALPRVPLLVTYWLGDEDFPSSCKILFDSSASHYLPIDACAVIGSMLAQKIISASHHKGG